VETTRNGEGAHIWYLFKKASSPQHYLISLTIRVSCLGHTIS
jgi:hypothetical protein